jgi:two-component system cell cycle sensor histidine kinase/response regulator CckA
MTEKILFVDDEPLFRKSMLKLLNRRDFQVDIAANGTEAFMKMRENRYAVVLLDLVLPDIDGLEIAQHIKEHDPYCAVIILTGQSSIRSAKLAVRCGCFDYLTKPCKIDKVCNLLKTAIENRRLKLDLEASVSRNKNLAEASWESIAFFTKDCISEVNSQFYKLFKINEEDITKYSIFDFLPELSLLLTPGNECAGQPASIIKSEGLCLDGTIFPVELRLASLKGDNESGWVIVVRDLTQRYQEEQIREKLEKQLTHAQRMESIGTMAGSVAHDLNNLLSSMVTLPELMLLDMPENARYRKDLDKIWMAGKQAAAVVGDLLTITRGSTCNKEVENINSIVDDYRNSSELAHLREKHPHIVINVDTAKPVRNSRLSSIHVMKSIVNLVRNGIESIEGKGAISIHTSNKTIRSSYNGYETIPRGEYAVLTVADTGAGIEPHHLEHIFKPFYSKKKINNCSGTGLGLTVIMHTMRDHYGYIDIRNAGSGSIFELYFPTVVQEEIQPKSSTSLQSILGKGEKVLIVDDQKEQREIISSVLKRLGYQTAIVEGGEKAVDHLKRNSVDLVILDMVMHPGMNGYQTLQQILQINPNQKAVITSGHLNHPDKEKTEALGVTQYLAKPISLSLLAETIQKVIQQ